MKCVNSNASFWSHIWPKNGYNHTITQETKPWSSTSC